MDLYDSKYKFYLAIDCIIFGFDDGKLKLLVFNRKIDPFKGELSLIGSFIRVGESVQDASNRVLLEVTGLKNMYLKELKTYSAVERDPGYRCISIAQFALIRINDDIEKIVKEKKAKWFDVNAIPKLILDHNLMANDALKRLEKIARHAPIGFELLPEKFTIPQLQTLYEAIYRRKLDPRNFRKKIVSFDVIVKLEEKDKTSSKKGAFLYRFDHNKYKKLQESGYNFEV